MQIKELLENSQKNTMPHLYLDMDGVQADFFGAWADKHNVKHWKAITNKENEIDQLAQSSAKEVYDFFRELKPLPGGAEIISWIRANKIPYTVLSAPLRGPYSQDSIQAKKDWLDEHNPGTSGNAIFTSAKFKYAMKDGIPQVLVDDFGPYLQKWRDAGGIAVKHEDEHEDSNSATHTVEMLEKIYSKYLNK